MMEPIGASKSDIEAVLAPMGKNPITGEMERIPAARRIDAILNHPQAEQIVAALEPQFLFGLIQQAGQNDAMGVIELATPVQIQAFVDFDTWQKDAFQLEEFSDWMAIFLQREDAEFAALYRQMDREAFVLWFREAVAVYEWEEDIEILDRIEGPVHTSPDGQYAFVIPQEESWGPQIRLFVERLYAMDLDEAISLMSHARWALSMDLRETLYQERTARLSDLGYVPFDESMAVFAFVDPISWAKKTRVALREGETISGALRVGELQPSEPEVLAVQDALALADRPCFAAALADLSPTLGAELASDVLSATMTQFRALVQRVLVAEGGKPGDPDGLARSAERAIDTLSLALEFLTEGRRAQAARAIATVPLRELHRAGHSVTTQLQRQLRAMMRRGNLSVTEQPFSLLEPQDVAMCEGLLQQRPVRSSTTQARFRSVSDIQQAATRLGQIAFTELFFFAWMGFDRVSLVQVLEDAYLNDTPLDMVRFRTLFATFVLNRIIDDERALMPLSLDELDAALARLREPSDPDGALLARARKEIETLRPQNTPVGPFPLAFATETATWMIDEMLAHAPPTAREIAHNWVLLRPDGVQPPTLGDGFGKATVH